MNKSLFILLFLSLSAVAANDPPPRVIIQDLKEQTFDTNPFVFDCHKAPESPHFISANLEVENGLTPKSFLSTFEFELEPSVKLYLVRENQKIEITRSEGIFRFSILENLSDEVSPTLIEAVKDDITYTYRIDLDLEKQHADIVPQLLQPRSEIVCLKNQIWMGVGVSLFDYDQTITAPGTTVKFSTANAISSVLAAAIYPSPNWGFLASYRNAPGNIDAGAVQGVSNENFNWSTGEVAAEYRDSSWLRTGHGLGLYPYARFGFQQHSEPRVAIDPAGVGSLRTIQMTTVFAGVGTNVFDQEKYFFDFYVDYQAPLQVQGYSLAQTVILDAAMGLGRAFAPHWTFGTYASTQFHQFNYAENSGPDQQPGKINFIYTNFDLRLGYLW